jgi:toxin YoeB
VEIVFKTGAIDDIQMWNKSGNKIIQNRISALLDSISTTPESGIGKPERLKASLNGYWSRRITKEHRLMYKIDYTTQTIEVFSLIGHYSKNL